MHAAVPAGRKRDAGDDPGPRRMHCAGDRDPVADLVGAVAGCVQHRVGIAAGALEVSLRERRKKGSVELGIVALHPWRADGVRDSAGREQGDAATECRPGKGCGDGHAEVAAAPEGGQRREDAVDDDRHDPDLVGDPQLRQRQRRAVVQAQLAGMSGVEAETVERTNEGLG